MWVNSFLSANFTKWSNTLKQFVGKLAFKNALLAKFRRKMSFMTSQNYIQIVSITCEWGNFISSTALASGRNKKLISS